MRMSYIRNKVESAGNYLNEHANAIKKRLIKGTATALTAATLLGGLAGCMIQGKPAEQQTTPYSPGDVVFSNSNLFVGTIYDEDDLPPAINHRTEEEIAETGLTAQDVLNAYDQLSLDIGKAMYSTDSYDTLPKEVFEKLAVRFESITPLSYPGTNSRFVVPFYALDTTYSPRQLWFDDRVSFPAVPITIDFTTYLDGVCFTSTVYKAAVEQSQFENLMTSFSNVPYLLDYETLKSKLNDYDNYLNFEDQMAYSPITISRDVISNASPDQLQTLYDMITSLRSINLEQKLPDDLG